MLTITILKQLKINMLSQSIVIIYKFDWVKKFEEEFLLCLNCNGTYILNFESIV